MRPKDPRTIEEKFHQSYTIADNGCWVFTPIHTNGYGRFYYDYKTYIAHRMSWVLHNGALPPNILVRHGCDNPPCVNPDHLELGTEAQNAQDAVDRRRTLTGEANTFAKLTTQQVIEIRANASGGTPLADIAVKYNCTLRNVRNIVNRKTWKFV